MLPSAALETFRSDTAPFRLIWLKPRGTEDDDVSLGAYNSVGCLGSLPWAISLPAFGKIAWYSKPTRTLGSISSTSGGPLSDASDSSSVTASGS
eukprot:scaffold7307_cov125-Isochrysis_galbana.AAC.2